MTPNVSAYAYLWGNLDFNSHPLAPMEYKADLYMYPGNGEMWDPHMVIGYYMGTSL